MLKGREAPSQKPSVSVLSPHWLGSGHMFPHEPITVLRVGLHLSGELGGFKKQAGYGKGRSRGCSWLGREMRLQGQLQPLLTDLPSATFAPTFYPPPRGHCDSPGTQEGRHPPHLCTETFSVSPPPWEPSWGLRFPSEALQCAGLPAVALAEPGESPTPLGPRLLSPTPVTPTSGPLHLLRPLAGAPFPPHLCASCPLPCGPGREAPPRQALGSATETRLVIFYARPQLLGALLPLLMRHPAPSVRSLRAAAASFTAGPAEPRAAPGTRRCSVTLWCQVAPCSPPPPDRSGRAPSLSLALACPGGRTSPLPMMETRALDIAGSTLALGQLAKSTASLLPPLPPHARLPGSY